ncbi:MAG: Maf family protein [Clostridiales bacterium]|jgi:septum formation protein|nr:Maf family protein [Clostridiales bacterium]
MRVILASSSPRRAALLKELIDDFEIIHPLCEENTKEILPDKAAMELAVKKAEEVFKNIDGDRNAVIIACDTIVCFNGEILKKPKNYDEAYATLKKLNAKEHCVYSGVCVIVGGEKRVFCDCSKVLFKRNSEEEIRGYIVRYKPFDKAGAYGIQDDALVERCEGSVNNVIGLPTEKLKLFI